MKEYFLKQLSITYHYFTQSLGKGNSMLIHLILLFISLVVSLFVNELYHRFYKSRATGSQIHYAFPLLSVSITAIFIGLQHSLPLSLGLLGALSIVRFRTPIKEPEEIGFLMLIIASSIACATAHIKLLIPVLIVAFVGLVMMHLNILFKRPVAKGLLVILVNANAFKNLSNLTNFLEKSLQGRVENMLEKENMLTLSYSFSKRDEDALEEIKTFVKKASKDASFQIYYHEK